MSDTNRIRRVTVRFTENEYAVLKENVKRSTLSIAAYVRRRSLGRTVPARMQKTDIETCCLLRQIGGLVKQLFAREIADPEQTRIVLDELRQAVARVARGSDDS